MKIYDTHTFEKLKIRPVNVLDLQDSPDNETNFHKSDLKTFDVVKYQNSRSCYNMVFCNTDIDRYTHHFQSVIHVEHGVFCSYNDKSGSPWNYMKMYDYSDDLGFERDSDFAITDVWVHPDDFVLMYNISVLSQEFLKTVVDEYKFKHIKLR